MGSGVYSRGSSRVRTGVGIEVRFAPSPAERRVRVMQTSRRTSLALATIVAIGFMGPVSAYADFTALTSSDQINSTLVDFDSFAAGFVTETTNTATSAYGFYFSDLPASPSLSGEYIVANADGGHVLDVLGGSSGFDGQVSFAFDELVYAVGIDYNSSTQLSFNAYDVNGNAINADGSIQTASTGGIGFFGIASDIGIGSVMIHDSLGTFELDNLQFTTEVVATPVPGALTMAVLGLGLIGWVRHKR